MMKSKEKLMDEFFQDLREEIKKCMIVKDEYICPAYPVRTIVQLKDGNWYCVETEKVYQLTEVNYERHTRI